MLGIGKIAGGGDGYYLEAVAKGADEYYRGVGEAPGRWIGSAAVELGLSGEVEPDDLRNVWDGLDPASGDKLGSFPNRKIHVFDLCFKAPKSVSLMFGLGRQEVTITVRDAHDAAVTAAMNYVDENATVSRTGKGGARQIEVSGIVAARFRHRTSRTGDPHLHTHVLTANMAQGVDGKWRTLDGRVLLAHSLTAGYLYQAQLRYELTTRLGVEWEPIEHGVADVRGFDRETIRAFSDRRRQIEEHLDKVGFRSARGAEIATLETRPDKPDTNPATMRDVWEHMAAEVGFDPAGIDDFLDRQSYSLPTRPQLDGMLDHLRGPEGLTERASTFDRRDVLRAIASTLPAGAPLETIEALASEFVTHPNIIEIHERQGLDEGTTIRRRDGKVIATPNGRPRWSTAQLVRLEQRLVDQATGSVHAGVGMVEKSIVDHVLAKRPTIRGEQMIMVARLTTSGAGVEVVAAAAGTGKTFSLDAAREAWQLAGYDVIGASLAAEAAHELQSSAGIPSDTIAMMCIHLDSGQLWLDDRTVVVVDEAGMVGTRALAHVVDAAARAGAKVVLVGDPRQLPEIDAGGVLAGLATRLDPITLSENRRQRADWERDAVRQLRDGDIDDALDLYRRNGRLVTADSAQDVRTVMLADWWAWRGAGDSVRMLAVRHSDVDDLNGRARAYLSRAGDLSGPELVVGDRPFQRGDEVVRLRNNRRIGYATACERLSRRSTSTNGR